MPSMCTDQAKAVYREAIDRSASDDEGASWWGDVTEEIRQVVAAKSAKAAAPVIAWWHHDWACVSDTPLAAAQRIRTAAARLSKSAMGVILVVTYSTWW